MAEFARVVPGATDPFRRIARIRRRVLALHLVPAAATLALMDWVIGADAIRGVDRTVIVLVCVGAAAQLGGLVIWARWTWRLRGLRPPPSELRSAANLWERRRLSEARADRAVGAFGRVLAVGCCWWLEWTGLAAALFALSDPDADIPDWSVTNAVLPMLVLAMLGLTVVVRFPARLLRRYRRPPRALLRDPDPLRDFYDL